MEFLTTMVPNWVSLLFLSVIWIPVYLIANQAKKAAFHSGKNSKLIFVTIILFYGFYFFYVATACLNGLFDEASLPPKILKMTMMPLLLFLVVVIFNIKLTKDLVNASNAGDLVKLHIFRLIGSFFLILLFFAALPKAFALIAGIGDLLTALSSPFVAKALKEKRAYAKRLALAWNTFGFLDILATSISAFILTKLSIETGSMGVDALASFPFCFIPAFAPATIIFLHLIIYRKLLQTK